MMTREAKTGLLLGLVFIVAIAIVLRGVHDNGVDPLDKALAAPVAAPQPPNEHPAITGTITSQIGNHADSTKRLPGGKSDLLPDSRVVQADRSEQPNYRHVQPLPGNALTNANPDLFEPVAGIPALPSETEKALKRALELAGHSPTHGNTVLVDPKRPETWKSPAKTYVVKDGDDLSRIALKFYGKTEGNRLVNIKRIYQANKAVMTDMDTVRSGQKLRIPPLPNTKTTFDNAPKTNPRNPSVIPQTPTSRAKIYVVADGDSLWSIAAEKLGNGARYPELVKLNKTMLNDEDELSLGMKLHLPGK